MGALGGAGEGLDAQLVRFGLKTQKKQGGQFVVKHTHTRDIIRGTPTFGVVSAELWAVGEGLVGSEAGFTSCGGRRNCQKKRKILQEVELVSVVEPDLVLGEGGRGW